MRKQILCVLLVSLTLCTLSARDYNAKKSKIEDTVARLKADLMDLEEVYIDELDFTERRKAVEKIDSMLENLDLILMLSGINHPRPTPVARPTPPPSFPEHMDAPLTQRQFSFLLKVFKEIRSVDEKLEYLEALTGTGSFTTHQCKLFLENLPFDGDKVRAFRTLYASIYNPGEIGEMIHSFESVSTRRKLNEEFLRLTRKP